MPESRTPTNTDRVARDHTFPVRRPWKHVAARLAAAAGAVLTATLLSAALAPAAQAAPHACWSAAYDTSISKFAKTQVDYDAEFHWCATNGKVDTFIVDKAYANATGWTNDAGIDLQPFKPTAFGAPTFDVYLNVWGNKKATPIVVGFQGTSVTLATGDYRDFYDISLHGDGTITGTKRTYR